MSLHPLLYRTCPKKAKKPIYSSVRVGRFGTKKMVLFLAIESGSCLKQNVVFTANTPSKLQVKRAVAPVELCVEGKNLACQNIVFTRKTTTAVLGKL